jgi:hypothetical protein
MKTLLLATLLFSCGAHGAVRPAGAQAMKMAAQSSVSPETLVRQFYTWYTGQLNRNNYEPIKNRLVALKYLTPEFYRRVPRLTREMNADILICAQDWDPAWSKNIEITPAVIRGARATTTATLNAGGTDTLRMNLTLRRVSNQWKIDGVSCAE